MIDVRTAELRRTWCVRAPPSHARAVRRPAAPVLCGCSRYRGKAARPKLHRALSTRRSTPLSLCDVMSSLLFCMHCCRRASSHRRARPREYSPPPRSFLCLRHRHHPPAARCAGAATRRGQLDPPRELRGCMARLGSHRGRRTPQVYRRHRLKGLSTPCPTAARTRTAPVRRSIRSGHATPHTCM